mmetsp:Transcript_15699/g.39482  ORF Transcript_15699/g.39482 Transcript_15699/m.39482 type:complete len:229 (+) Transcript_15699:1548-2234(+)
MGRAVLFQIDFQDLLESLECHIEFALGNVFHRHGMNPLNVLQGLLKGGIVNVDGGRFSRCPRGRVKGTQIVAHRRCILGSGIWRSESQFLVYLSKLVLLLLQIQSLMSLTILCLLPKFLLEFCPVVGNHFLVLNILFKPAVIAHRRLLRWEAATTQDVRSNVHSFLVSRAVFGLYCWLFGFCFGLCYPHRVFLPVVDHLMNRQQLRGVFRGIGFCKVPHERLWGRKIW